MEGIYEDDVSGVFATDFATSDTLAHTWQGRGELMAVSRWACKAWSRWHMRSTGCMYLRVTSIPGVFFAQVHTYPTICCSMNAPTIVSSSSIRSAIPPQQVIWRGTKTDSNGIAYDAIVTKGVGASDIIYLNTAWKSQALNLATRHLEEALRTQNPDIIEWMEITFCDSHWHWPTKEFMYSASRYDWFFYRVDTKILGLIISFHPEQSSFDREDIYYIEYICVAPECRKSFFGGGVFSGIGTDMLAITQKYFGATLLLRYGFGLHSIAKAQPFYRRLGMTPFPQRPKDGMLYFEMQEDSARALAGAV